MVFLGSVVEENVDVQVRDGTVLSTNIYRPDSRERFPGILMRTPYGKPSGSGSVPAGFERYVRSGYVVVVQDTRGRHKSGGEYVPFYAGETGDAEDGYDSVEWLASQPYCNGRIGTMGASYCAWMQWMLARLRPPHLVAMCAYSIPVELTDLDYPGAFRAGRRVKWLVSTMSPDIRRRRELPGPRDMQEARRIWEEVEAGKWLYFMPWSKLPEHLPAGLAEYVGKWLKEPASRPWRFSEAHREIEVPNLDFSGWFDHCCGTMDHLSGMQENARTEVAREQTKLVIGPWNHVMPGQRKIGNFDFGPEASLDVTGAIIRWFDYWLKGLENGTPEEPPVRYFVMGSGRWRSSGSWPPAVDEEIEFFIDSEGNAASAVGSGTLNQAIPGGGPCDCYRYDPKDPVPTLWTQALFTMPQDRRELEYRSDILYYRTPPLDEALEVVGHPRTVLYASSSAKDTDFFARLVDEDPDGPAMEVCYGMVRARHRISLERTDLLEPGEITEFRIRLGPIACNFQQGHSIRLEVTSSDFPNFDRNHNTGGNDLFESRLVVAEQRVFHTENERSRLIVGVKRQG